MAWLCGSTRAVDEEQFELGTDRGGTGVEAGPFQQLPERGQAFPEPFGEARVIADGPYPFAVEGPGCASRLPTPAGSIPPRRSSW
jgi:hypothetical protein